MLNRVEKRTSRELCTQFFLLQWKTVTLAGFLCLFPLLLCLALQCTVYLFVYANFNVIFSENAESVKNAEKSGDESIISHQKSVRVGTYASNSISSSKHGLIYLFIENRNKCKIPEFHVLP